VIERLRRLEILAALPERDDELDFKMYVARLCGIGKSPPLTSSASAGF
jgi:hypothetical protein